MYKRVREAGIRGEDISFDFDRRGAATQENRIARLWVDIGDEDDDNGGQSSRYCLKFLFGI